MTGPRAGSRVSALLALNPGERLFLEAPAGRLAPFMSQISVDIGRAGLRGVVHQAHMLGVDPANRTVTDLVVITRPAAA